MVDGSYRDFSVISRCEVYKRLSKWGFLLVAKANANTHAPCGDGHHKVN